MMSASVMEELTAFFLNPFLNSKVLIYLLKNNRKHCGNMDKKWVKPAPDILLDFRRTINEGVR